LVERTSGQTTCAVTDPCPCELVTIDAGADAFSGVGAVLDDAKLGGGSCWQFCGSSQVAGQVLVCVLVDETTVKCMAGCS
jgi:hypothetical protein